MKDLRKAVPYINLVDQPWWKKILKFFAKRAKPRGTCPDEWIIHVNHKQSRHKEQIRQYLLQKPTAEMFARPEKPDQNDWFMSDLGLIERYGGITKVPHYDTVLEQWQNWQPVFLDWHGDAVCLDGIVEINEIMHLSINEFLYIVSGDYAFHWNPEHSKIRELFYPDI